MALSSPLANFEGARGEAILPAVLIVLRVEHSLFVLLGGDVLLPLLITVAVLPTQPTMVASLMKHHFEVMRIAFMKK